MKLFEELTLKFEKPDWSRNPEFGLIDTILEQHLDIFLLFKDDLMGKGSGHQFGRGDVPSVEQIVRAAIFKEMKGLDYRGLEYAQSDSRICANFIKLEQRKPYSFQMFQSYISRIRPETLQRVLVRINQLAIEEGYEDLEKLCQDTTVVEANIKYPTNNSLVWDCIHESHRLLCHLKQEMEDLSFIDYTRQAKKTYYKINLIKRKDVRYELFNNQLILFTKVINQTSNVIKKKSTNLEAVIIQMELENLLEVMCKVYDMALEHEIFGNPVPNSDKIFSIYEQHTDIIVKGQRQVEFGHKVSVATGASNLILDCQVLKGNPSDKTLFKGVVNRVVDTYGITPRDTTTDGGYASLDNLNFAKKKNIKNIVFNKVVGSLQNQTSSKNMETRLKRWRSSVEAVISNLKRGFDLRRCNWKGWIHFQAKVMWSVLAYNFRVLTALVVESILKAKQVQTAMAA
jgi:IS5 family transposase